MANPTTGTGFSLAVERTIAAPPERVFDAFTQAQQLARWFGPTDEYTITVHALEARTGGRYRVEMKHSGGNVHVVGGVYEEVSRPNRIVFSWKWEDQPELGDSRITVSFVAKGAGTQLRLVQEQLPTAEAREKHSHGWDGSLDKLVRLF
jgi:uncharacterized protein YndB with AHSA1/START domain